jgi:hypothetical protein
MHADRMRMEAAIAQAAQSVNVAAPTANQHMAELQASLQHPQAGIQATAAEMIRENREAVARLAAQQGLSGRDMERTVERALANAQPTVNVDVRSVVIDTRSVNVDARSVNVGVDARTVNNVVGARSATVQQMVDSRSVANVVN